MPGAMLSTLHNTASSAVMSICIPKNPQTVQNQAIKNQRPYEKNGAWGTALNNVGGYF